MRGRPLYQENSSLNFVRMITLTERAAKRVEALYSELEGEENYLRIAVKAGGCSGLEYDMSFENKREEDIKIESLGVSLITDPVSLTYLKDSKIDYDDGLNGKGFEILNPNAKSSCGCGKSFN